MNSRFLLSITTIAGLLMPSFFYAMAPARRIPRETSGVNATLLGYAFSPELVEGLPSLMTRISEEGDRGTVTFVPKEESFVIAPDKKIGFYGLNHIAMDQGSDGQLLAVMLQNDAHNAFIYAINLQKKYGN